VYSERGQSFKHNNLLNGFRDEEDKKRHLEFLHKIKMDTLLRREQLKKIEEHHRLKIKRMVDHSFEEDKKRQEEKQRRSMERLQKLKEQLQSRERQRQEYRKQSDKMFKLALKRKPLHEQIEERFRTQVQEKEISEKKERLQSIKEMYKELDHDNLQSHSKNYFRNLKIRNWERE